MLKGSEILKQLRADCRDCDGCDEEVLESAIYMLATQSSVGSLGAGDDLKWKRGAYVWNFCNGASLRFQWPDEYALSIELICGG